MISTDDMNIEMLQTLYKLKPLTKGCLNIEDNKICNISNGMLKIDSTAYIYQATMEGQK